MLKKLMATFALGLGIALLAQTILSDPAVAAQDNKHARAQKLFQQYCASCHGVDGKGGGTVASSLKTPIPDLTTIEKREGKFNQLRVQQVISGEVGVTAHGEKDMPVWGYIFRTKKGESTAMLDVHALASYLKSIQQK